MKKFFAYLRTTTFRKNIIIAAATVFILILVAFFSLRYYTRHGEGVKVPALKGMSVEKAIQALESEGFRYQIDSVFVVDKRPGLVIEQDPDPGSFVKNNRTIYLTIITRQAPNVKLPELVDQRFLEARSVLESYGLKLGDTTYKADIARDVVLEVHFAGNALKAGEIIPRGSKIDLVLGDGRGANEVEIPLVVGSEKDAAIFAIKGMSLTLGTITYEGPITDSASVVVIKQSPMPTDSLRKVSLGTPINIVLSNKKQ